MKSSSFQQAIQAQFDCLTKKVIKRAAMKYNRDISRRLKHEVPFSEISDINVNIKMYIFDHLRMYIFAILPLDRYIFLSDKIFL